MNGIVVDLGCRTYGPETNSISELLRVYQPKLLLGYDLRDDIPEGVETIHHVGQTVVVQTIAAAWTDRDELRYHSEGTRTRVATIESPPDRVLAFDLAGLVQALPPGIVVKMDVEGAEYRLIPHLIRTGVADRIEELLIEWHDEPPYPRARKVLARAWPGVLNEWWM